MTEHVQQLESTAKADDAAPILVGLLAEFADVDLVMKAARALRDDGFSRWDVHSPFPIHGIDTAMGIRPTVLPWIVLAGGVTGVVVGFGLQWFTNAVDYPFLISGKPMMSVPAWIPVIFELGVLLAAFAAVLGMLGLNRLPRLYNPLFKSDRFRRVTDDRFFIVIQSTDPKFDETQCEKRMLALGATAVERVME